MTPYTIWPFWNGSLSLGIWLSLPCVSACIRLWLSITIPLCRYILFYVFRDYLGPSGHYRMLTYQHIHVHPLPQPGQGDSHSGRIPPCWCSARSCRCLGSGIRQHLPRGGQKLVHYRVVDSAGWTGLSYQPFNWVTCRKIYKNGNWPTIKI